MTTFENVNQSRGRQTGADVEEIRSLRLLLSVEEAGDVLSISRTAIFRLLKEERLQSVKIDKRRLIPLEAIHDFVDQLTEAS